MHLEVIVGVDKPTLIALPPISESTTERITYVFLRDDEGKLVKKFGLVPRMNCGRLAGTRKTESPPNGLR